MNKLILPLVFVIFTIAIVSCVQEYNSSKSVTIKEYSGNKSLSVYKFSYEGHNYIYFFKRDHVAESGGVIHDPNCCK